MASPVHDLGSLPMDGLPPGVSQRFEDVALRVVLPLEVYGLPALFRACYRLTDRCFVYLSPPKDGTIEVSLIAKTGQIADTDNLAGSFLNDLIDQRLRIDIGEETRVIRELIVAQAFAAVDVIDDQGRPVDQLRKSAPASGDDPQGLQQWRPVS